MQIEKRKNDFPVSDTHRPRRVGAVILIGLGILFLLMNAGVFSMADVGQFFGEMGGGIGRFFGQLGGAIGEFFGGVGRAIGDLWPLLLIIAGLVLLFRRRRPQSDEP